MARLRAEDTSGSDHAEVVRWYREQLSQPAQFPWADLGWSPVTIGPTWQTTPDGLWLLPEHTLGWDALGWAGCWLQHTKGVPWVFSLEQARWLLWWYALDEDDRPLYVDGVIQRLKGWGKDPLCACVAAIELLGPCRPGGWDDQGPIATDKDSAWVQVVGTSLEGTRKLMRLFPGLFTAEAKRHYGIQVGRELVHALGDTRLIQAVTSAPATIEGDRPTLTIRGETQHWLSSNDGHDLAAVLERNAAKSPDGWSRSLANTNAYEPSEDSVAQRDREAYELAESGGSLTTGILYDSVEAPPEASLSAEAAPEVVCAIRGDSVWLKPDRPVQSILDTRNPPSQSRRWWYNQIVSTEEMWVDAQAFDALAAPDRVVSPSDEIVLFFDGGKTDDATGLVGCRLSDGYAMTLGMWQSPPGERGRGWVVDRHEVDRAVTAVMDSHTVVALWADPSHALDDVMETRFWDAVIDEWHRRWKDQMRLWAIPRRHSVVWDMTDSSRRQAFTSAAEQCAADIGSGSLAHDGDSRLRRHVHNAYRSPNAWGVSLRKHGRESHRKIDLAVCMVGARMLRRAVLNASPSERVRSGKVW